MKLWAVGQYRATVREGTVWDLQGVFTTRTKAGAACVNERYCLFPVIVNKEYPDRTILAPHAEWPKMGRVPVVPPMKCFYHGRKS